MQSRTGRGYSFPRMQSGTLALQTEQALPGTENELSELGNLLHTQKIPLDLAAVVGKGLLLVHERGF